MSKPIILFLAGLVVGAASTALLTKKTDALPGQESHVGRLEAEPTPEVQKALAKIKQLEEENLKLKAQTQELRKAGSEVTLTPNLGEVTKGGDEANADREARREERNSSIENRIKGMMASRMQARITRLKSAITLSDGQLSGIETFMSQRNELRMEYMSKRFSGEITEEEEAEYTEKLQSMSVGSYLKENLDEEQYGDYEEYLQEQNEAELASYASRQLSNLVQTVRITDVQKDQAYEAFYLEAQSSIPEGEEFNARRRSFGPEAADNLQTQLIALENILDEGQMETYRTQVENRQQAIGGSGGPSGNRNPVSR